MVDLICMGFVELSETQSKRKLQNEEFLLKVVFEPTTFRSRLLLANHYTMDMIDDICRLKDVMEYWTV